MEAFKLKMPYPDDSANKQPVIRLKPTYYQILTTLKTKTGLSMGNIVEQCMDFALDHMMEGEDHADA